MSKNSPVVRRLGVVPYGDTLELMRAFTDARLADSNDELWLLEHEAVFSQGQAGKAEHLLDPGDIPVFQSDRGGQVTYHGPGQVVLYLLLDLRRLKVGVRDLVDLIEAGIIEQLQLIGIAGTSRRDAPGVYVGDAKIAQLGLRVRRGCSYHGLSLNVDMDLSPFERINPCGFSGLEVTSIAQCTERRPDKEAIENSLIQEFVSRLATLS
ncbi:MAG: lipoyl(octanoyl) transferase [Halieaceae bacterium]|jgi:lipoyl(octanoyl) transferase